MIIIAIIFFIIILPLFAADSVLDSKCYERRVEWQNEIIRSLNKEIDSTLGIQEDHFEAILKHLEVKRLRFRTFPQFDEELGLLLRTHLLPPEMLLKQYHEVGRQPLVNTIRTLENFIERWKRSAAFCKGLKLPLDIAQDYSSEWQSFAISLIAKLEQGSLADSDLDRIYVLIANTFFKFPNDLKRSFEDLELQWKAPLPVCLSFFRDVMGHLEGVFQPKGSILWDILLNELLRRNVDISKFPGNYLLLDGEYFLGTENPIYKALQTLEQVPPASQSAPAALQTISNSPSKTYASLSAMTSSSLISRKSINSRPPTPSPEYFIGRIREAFGNTNDLDIAVKTFETPDQILLHASFTIDTLEKLLEFYKNFLSNIKPSHSGEATPWEDLAQKVKVNRFREPNGQLTQPMATDISGIGRIGPLCFNFSQTYPPACPAPDGFTKGTLTSAKIQFERIPSDLPGDIGANTAMFLLECLFGISTSIPNSYLAMNNILFLSSNPVSSQIKLNSFASGDQNTALEEYSRMPTKWHVQARSSFIAAQRKLTSIPLRAFLNDICAGKLSLHELDPGSFGLEYLFSLMTGSTRLLESYGVVKNNSGKYHLERIGPSDLMAPLFQQQDEQSYCFISRNCLHLFLPLLRELVHPKVKESFLRENIYFLLAHWLKGLGEIREYYDDLIKGYGLDAFHNISRDLGVNITEAEMLGLSTSARPNVISKMIDNYIAISTALRRPNVTYREIFQIVNSQEETCIQSTIEKALQSETMKKNTSLFFEIVIPEIIKQLQLVTSQLIDLKEPSRFTLEELDEFLRLSHECFSAVESSTEGDFGTLISMLPHKAKEFFHQKYDWWQNERKGPDARLILKAWELLIGNQGQIPRTTPIIDSTRIRTPEFKITAAIKANLPQYCRAMEARRTPAEMLEDLIEQTNLSGMSPVVSIQLMDFLLTLSPRATRYHQSWTDITSVFRTRFFGLPKNIISFMQRLELTPIDEQSLLRLEQGTRLDEYMFLVREDRVDDTLTTKRSAASLLPLSSSSASLPPLTEQEEFASTLLRQLLKGSLRLEQGPEQDLHEAIIDLFVLPRPHDSRCIGFASFAQSSGGVFERHLEVGGDHFVLPWSPYWVKALISKQTLPALARTFYLSHATYPLVFQWLYALSTACPDIKFHPWYMKTLLLNLKRFQGLLSVLQNPTFSDILDDMFFGIKCSLELKLQTYNNDFDKIETNRRVSKATTLESQLPDYSQLNRRGQTLRFCLDQEDALHRANVKKPPCNLDQAATESLKYFSPNESDIHSIFHTLAVSSNFSINLQEIDPAAWSNYEILRQLANYHLPSKLMCLQFVSALRMGCSPTDLSLKNDASSLKISGFNTTISGECDAQLLSQLISIFPGTVDLDLSSNGIRTLAPFVDCLRNLSQLRSLSLSDNPLHRPAPLSHLTLLEALALENTSIPMVCLSDLRLLISPENAATVLPRLQESRYVNRQNGDSRAREVFLLSQSPFSRGFFKSGPSTLFGEMDQILKRGKHRPGDIDYMICILEHLAEAQWCQALSYGDPPQTLSTRVLFALLQPPYFPRQMAFKLVYAITHGLPPNTNPHTLGFGNSNIATYLTCNQETSCLRKLDITGAVLLSSIESLSKFTNLIELKLSRNNQTRALAYLPQMNQLEVLEVSMNDIPSLSGLHTTDNVCKFPSLREFIFSHNSLTSGDRSSNFNGLSFLLELSNLRRINLSHNHLTRLPMLGNIAQQLELLDLRHNLISDGDLGDTRNIDTPSRRFLFTPQIKSSLAP